MAFKLGEAYRRTQRSPIDMPRMSWGNVLSGRAGLDPLACRGETRNG